MSQQLDVLKKYVILRLKINQISIVVFLQRELILKKNMFLKKLIKLFQDQIKLHVTK